MLEEGEEEGLVLMRVKEEEKEEKEDEFLESKGGCTLNWSTET